MTGAIELLTTGINFIKPNMLNSSLVRMAASHT